MRGDTDRTDARAAASMRDAEGFVEIQVADIGSEIAGAAETDLGVHVGTVHVNLASGAVDDLADVANALLEDAVGGRVGDHEGGKRLAVLVGLGPEVGEVHVAIGIAGHRDDLHARHDGTGGVRAVGGGGNEAGGAMGVAARLVVGADGEESGIFALRACVWL